MCRRKKVYKIMELLIASCMVFMTSGCGSEKNDGTDRDGEKLSISSVQQGEKDSDDKSQGESVSQRKESNLPHLVSCSYSDNAYDENTEEHYGEFFYKGVILSQEDASKYPKLAEALLDNRDDRLENLREEYELFLDNRETALQEDFLYQVWGKETTVVVRADEKVVSLKASFQNYGGGAHEYYGNTGMTYDIVTGEELDLTDVVVDEGRFKTVLVEEMLENCFPHDEESDEEYRRNAIETYLEEHEDLGEDDDYSWVLGYEGVTIYFNPYSLFSYADGMQVVNISFAEYPELFDSSYTNTPDRYVTEISMCEPLQVDLDGDGKMNSLELIGSPDENGNYTYGHLLISKDDQSTEKEVYFYTADAYLVKAAEGKYALYVFGSTDNDYRYPVICMLEEEVTMLEDGYQMAPAVIPVLTGQEEEVFTEIFTNPDSVLMEQRIECLSTYMGLKEYYVSENGLPVSDDPWFTLEEGRRISLTALQDVEGTAVDEAGKETGGAVIKTGDSCIIYRTDGESFVDLQLSDGSLVRIFVEKEEWPITINGMNEDEVFDGMIYAG